MAMEHSTEIAQLNMIQQQIRPWDVLDDRVLETLATVPRESFVPDAYRGLAFADIEVPIGHGQSMLPPRIVGRMLQALGVTSHDNVLEIGTGTGYVTACLARLGGQVTGLELYAALADQARANLASLGVDNCEVHSGDGLAAPVGGGPFDAIAVTGSLPAPEALAGLKQQLKPGGRLFAVVGEDPVMEAVLITRLGEDNFRQMMLFETSIPALVNAPRPRQFVF